MAGVIGRGLKFTTISTASDIDALDGIYISNFGNISIGGVTYGILLHIGSNSASFQYVSDSSGNIKSRTKRSGTWSEWK